jgi:hypothetical protein
MVWDREALLAIEGYKDQKGMVRVCQLKNRSRSHFGVRIHKKYN